MLLLLFSTTIGCFNTTNAQLNPSALKYKFSVKIQIGIISIYEQKRFKIAEMKILVYSLTFKWKKLTIYESTSTFKT